MGTAGPTDGPTAVPTNAPTAGPTATPTNAPTAGPTNVPTAGPTDAPTTAGPSDVPTDGPSNDPTTAPVAPPTPVPSSIEVGGVCEEDVAVVKQVGGSANTDLSLHKNKAIRIVSQDRSTVTVQLQQAWDKPAPGMHDLDEAWVENPWVDYIYNAYRPNNFNEVCFEETKVPDATVYAKDITIQCAVTKPYALLEICLADADGNKRLQFNSEQENGVVPKCCHPTFAEETPVVCYTVEISCVTACVVDDEEEDEENIRAEIDEELFEEGLDEIQKEENIGPEGEYMADTR